jgi:tricorn protease
MNAFKSALLIFIFTALGSTIFAQQKGYYRFPSINNDLVVFTAEGDLWKYNQSTGASFRITTNQGVESNASISPDGKSIAFNAEYEGPNEIYLIGIDGGIPKRLTWEGSKGGGPKVYGWTKEGKLIVSTSYYSTLPTRQLTLLDVSTLQYSRLPLAQADEGTFDENGNIYFTRFAFQGSHTKRYKGGTAQNLWKFDGKNEAVPLTADYAGTSKNPMFYNGRLYFLTDRDGTMNLWSMAADGKDLKQHTQSVAWDLKDAELQNGKVIYQKQADLYVYDIAGNQEKLLDISLVSDFDQKRTLWEKEPMKKLQALSISKTGSHVLLTSRGRIFSAPVDGGRWTEVTRKYGIRFKQAKFSGDKDEVVFLSDESGEMELWKTDRNGFTSPTELTSGSQLLIMNFQPSPNGKYIAYTEKDYALKLYDTTTKTTRLIDQDDVGGFGDLK